MQSRRWRVIALGLLLAIIGAAVPITAAGWLSWRMARADALDFLTLVAQTGITRAEWTFSQARSAMEAMDRSEAVPCSAAHIAEMRVATVNVPSVEEVGYLEDGFIQCTSWGPLAEKIPKSDIDYTTFDGMEVSFRIAPSVSEGNPMTALHLGNYNTLIVPSRFLDIPMDRDVAVTLMAESGHLIYARNSSSPDLAATLVDAQGSGGTEGHLYSVVRENGLVAVAMESRAAVKDQLAKQLAIFVPIGAFIALFIVGLVYWISKKRLSPKAELEIAIRNREFVVHYQPLVQLSTGICLGAEALVRWRRPDGTLVRPDLFIPLAEETGLIIPITDQVIDAVIADLQTLLVQDRTLHIAINLCAADIASGRVLDVLDDKLKSTGIRNEQIWLEATERGFIDIDAASLTLKRARDAGHSVAIDDFGTGYSSLQHLQGLPLDALKIDKSFVDTIGKEAATSAVISHIIAMGQELGLFLVAEGIETEEQAAYLREKGVDFGQGWLYAKPLPVADFKAFHARSKTAFGIAPEVVSTRRL